MSRRHYRRGSVALKQSPRLRRHMFFFAVAVLLLCNCILLLLLLMLPLLAALDMDKDKDQQLGHNQAFQLPPSEGLLREGTLGFPCNLQPLQHWDAFRLAVWL